MEVSAEMVLLALNILAIIAFFTRMENRMTKVETTLELFFKKEVVDRREH